MVNIAYIEEQSFIYGPGCRLVIWVQGCSLKCKGCWNQLMWSFEPKKLYNIEDLLILINNNISSIEGVTILGGEPLQQYEPILELSKKIKAMHLSTMIFTGYEMHEIKELNMSEILNYTDILITGRYIQELRTLNHQWIGSTNQEIHFISSIYKDYIVEDNNYIEISIDENAQTTLLGFGDKKFLNDITS